MEVMGVLTSLESNISLDTTALEVDAYDNVCVFVPADGKTRQLNKRN